MGRGKTRYGGKPDKRSSCTGKKKYSQEDAEGVVRRRFKETLGQYNAYRCLHGCKLEDGSAAWHIGHKNRFRR